MNLKEWVDRQLEKHPDLTRKKVLMVLAERSGVHHMTLSPVDRGARMSHYEKAERLSRATSWEVSVPELCSMNPEEVLTAMAANWGNRSKGCTTHGEGCQCPES